MSGPLGTIILASAAMVLAATIVGVPQSTQRALLVPTDSCSLEALGRAAAADTSHLRRVTHNSTPGKSGEGGETTLYYDGDRPRVVVITYFGETGQTVVWYYLAAPDQYIVQQEVIEYDQPISSRSQPVIARRLPSTLYVCGDTVRDPVSEHELAQIRSDLRAVLAAPAERH
jgi:hypothetical protein